MGELVQFRPREQKTEEPTRNPIIDGIALGVFLGTFAALMRGYQSQLVTSDTPPRYEPKESA